MNKSTGNLSQRLFRRPDVTPYCGILLVILIVFFIVPVSDRKSVPVIEMPEAQSSDFIFGREDDLFIITIDIEGKIFYNGQRFDSPQYLHIRIEETIEELRGKRKVMLRVDKGVSFGKVQEVLKEIKKAGIDQIGLAVSKVSPEPEKKKEEQNDEH